jgi:hypothetical protein
MISASSTGSQEVLVFTVPTILLVFREHLKIVFMPKKNISSRGKG